MSTEREAVDTRTPVDYLEPEESEENPFRENSLAFLRIISLALSYILESDEPTTAAYSIAYALGLTSILGSKTMRELGRELGISHGTISYHAKRFCRMSDLPPSLLMKTQEQTNQSREIRNAHCD